jgi:hypothetical protein
MSDGSVPSLSEFDPTRIPYQYQVITDVRQNYNYKRGTQEILLSGSVGSAKSILMAHIALTHVLLYPKSRFCLGRLTMPDLKETILQRVLDHLDGAEGLEEGVHWEHNEVKSKISFCNGSEIISRSWHDQKFKKFRSLELSAGAIEELTENDERFQPFYNEFLMRIGRLPHVPESFLMSACNPDSPGHWVYKHFMINKSDTKHVYYSRSEDNPFLSPQYIELLKRELDPKTVRRMIYGEWIDIQAEVIYHQYSRDKNFKETLYEVNPSFPVHISHDFNIGENKPMSACLFQYVGDQFHIFDEVILDSGRTLDVYDELANRGYFERPYRFKVHGDATGKRKDTRSIHSDYDQIKSFLSNYRRKDGTGVIFELDVPQANPPLRARHNRTNAYCLNSEGKVRLYVYRTAPTVDEGMRRASLKKGGQYIEDDSKRFQHVTTAVGYGIMALTREKPEFKELNRWTTIKF